MLSRKSIGLPPLVFRALLFALILSGCAHPPIEPLTLEGRTLTVNNRTTEAWSNVEIWLNSYYRVTAKSIDPGQRFDVPLDTFVEGFGRRFDFNRAQIKDLRLTATLPDGRQLELKKGFIASGVAGALGGTR